MGWQPRGPVDNEVRQAVRGEDLIRHRATAARVEDVTFKEEEGDARAPHCAEQVVKPGGILRKPAGIALRAAVGGQRGADNGVNSVTAPGSDQ